MFKSIGYGAGDPPRAPPISSPRVSGQLIAHIGPVLSGRASSDPLSEHVERLPKIDNEILGYNVGGNRCLIRSKKNDRGFDCYVSMPFTKGVTERYTGRTMLILGSTAHHGEAMGGQFEGVIWEPGAEGSKVYGNTIRWINIGNAKEGFIGLDYNPLAGEYEGVATRLGDVGFLAKMLLDFGYDPGKKLFLLKPPHIVESEEGKELRRCHGNTLKELINL